jgi:hypothetical protein
MPIHMDAYLGYRASGARVKVTGKPGAVPAAGLVSGRAGFRAGPGSAAA